MARGGHARWRRFRAPNYNVHNISILHVYCQQQPIPALWCSVHEIWGTVAQARIRRSVFSCRRRVRALILADGRVTYYSVGERCDIVFIMLLIYLIVLITDNGSGTLK